ncbi:hypothetical protein JCM8097_009524 [Rhodosporidiobolus ruineniae]
MAKQLYVEIQQVAGPRGSWQTRPPSPPPPPSTTPTFAFTACHRSSLTHGKTVWLEISSSALLTALKRVFPTAGSLYGAEPGIDARAVYVQREQVSEAAKAVEGEGSVKASEEVDTLIRYLEEQFAYVNETIATFPPGTISFALAWAVFELGKDVEAVHGVTGERIALTLDSWSYVQEAMGPVLVLSCHFFQWAGTCWHQVPTTRKIREFKDLRSISSLPAFPLTEDKKKSLAERGKLYLEYAGGQIHVNHHGFFFTRAFTGATRLLGDGEVIIDVKSFRRANPTLDVWGDEVNGNNVPSQWAASSTASSRPCPPIPDDQVHLFPPTLHGFSLRAKRWGEFLISRLSPLTWRNESFAHLVIPDSYRRILKALVAVHAGELKSQLMTDVVKGKGNGLVIALHGTPGTGKTLTAEAIAEHLRRPLYVVSAGELGTTAALLESQLSKVLELATTWSAVLLIDEADIFLTKRDAQHLERNALVGIFLRLLEYFTGVLILTTNSIERFDEAFLSRFAVVLRFDELDAASRRTLWERFLLKATSSANLSAFDLDRLASHRLNGRDIKHAVQTAQAVALVEQEQLGMAHLQEVLLVAKSGWTGQAAAEA